MIPEGGRCNQSVEDTILTTDMGVSVAIYGSRRAIITPIYKSGLASDVSNYRPIALTCVTCKIMERVIVCDMLHFLRKQRLITKQQYGFIVRQSTTLNLFDALNDWSLAINNTFLVAVAYIDYAKAF